MTMERELLREKHEGLGGNAGVRREWARVQGGEEWPL